MKKFKARDARSVSLLVLRALEDDEAFLQPMLDSAVKKANLDDRDRRFAWQLVLGTARWLSQLDDAIGRHLRNRRVDQVEPDVLMILRLSAYQILFMDRVPDRAVVHSAVELGRRVIGPRSTGFINGLLRGLIRVGYTPSTEMTVSSVAIRFGHPAWLVREYEAVGGLEHAISRCEANNAKAPLTIRIPAKQRDAAIEALKAEGADLEFCRFAPHGAHLIDHPSPFTSASFQADLWTVQDEGSQLIVELLDPQPGQSVWDMCAAPGGKTKYILDRAGASVRITATDSHTQKVAILKDSLSKTDVRVLEHDARKALDVRFDRVLLDAPCTAVGLVRRHPEIRWRRTALDVEERAVLQWSLLLNAARHTENGGVLVYSVCSDLKAEGAAQIQKFLAAHPDFTLEPPAEAEYWQLVITDGTMQVNPHQHGCDGFFAARLRRRAV